MRRKTFKGLAFGVVAVLGLAACGSDSTSTDTTVEVSDITEAPAPTGLACEVTDTGGVDDKGFNQIAH